MRLSKGSVGLKYIFLTLTLLYVAKINGQETVIVDSKGVKVPQELLVPISVSFDNISFIDAIHEIANKGNFHLNYNESIIPKDKKISFKKVNEPAFVVLQKILKGTEIDIVVINPSQVVLTKLMRLPEHNESQSKHTVSGYVTDAESGEALIGANVYIKEINSGAATNAYGFYSISIPAGVYILRYSYIGYTTTEQFVELNSDITKNIELKSSSVTSDTVVVVSRYENENISSTNVGTINLLPVAITYIPVFLGEQDVLKTIQMLPGISTGREVDCGFSVRGGGMDQNLILLDEATIYNPFHVFGFFSIFYSDAIKSIDIIKGTAPAKYGGGISSFIDMKMNEGNMKEFNGIAGIGLIFSRLTLQGPFVKDKVSYLISARRTYWDGFSIFNSKSNVKFYLYDVNAKINYKIDNDDRIYISGYFGRDGFGYKNEFDMDWGNTTATLRWNHLFSNKLFLNSSFIYSNFSYETTINNDTDNDKFNYLSKVNNITVKEDFDYFLNTKNMFSFGAKYMHHNFLPAQMSLQGSTNYRFTIGKRYANEIDVYLSHEYKLTDKLKFEYGLRGWLFSVEGDKDYYNLEDIEKLNVEFHNTEDKTYMNIEPRFSATYLLDETSSLKLGFSRNFQNLHQVGNSVSGTPLDVWQPSSSVVKPQRADQISFGYFKNFPKSSLEFSAETYYKDMRNQIDEKDGADFILKNFFDSELVFGRGWAYGLELFLRKNSGDFTGWISYSLSRSERQFDEIDNGRAFPAKNNKTHEINIVLQYQASPKWVISVNWIFSSGFPITVPYGRYYIDGKKYIAYSDRNEYRLPPYHRMDIGVSYMNDVGGTWNFSLYNAYNRENLYTIIYKDKASGVIEANKLSLFMIIPSISYTLRF